MIDRVRVERYCLLVTSSNIFSNIQDCYYCITACYFSSVTSKALSVNGLKGLLLLLLNFCI